MWTKSFIDSYFDYDLEKMTFIYRELPPGDKTRNRDHIGKNAIVTRADGYQQLSVKKKRTLLHRVVFLLKHGYCPERIDHIDGNPSNNHYSNLREATQSQNMMNRKIQKNNQHGYSGLEYWQGVKKSCWRAKIMVDRKKISLGKFATKEEAIEARKAAELKYFGEYKREV